MNNRIKAVVEFRVITHASSFFSLDILNPQLPKVPSFCTKLLAAQAIMSTPELANEALSVWDDIALYWDTNYTKDGNLYWRVLQEPSIKRLLTEKLAKAETGVVRALDLATGNGIVARLVASYGAEVLATDGSDTMLEIAAGHVGEGMKMTFRKLDVTSDEDFEKLVDDEKQAVWPSLLNEILHASKKVCFRCLCCITDTKRPGLVSTSSPSTWRSWTFRPSSHSYALCQSSWQKTACRLHPAVLIKFKLRQN